MVETHITNSAEETKNLARKLAKKFTKGAIALTGNLGTGKTTFVQGFAQGLGIKEKIISPTFVLIRQHKVPERQQILYHIDLYRLDNKEAVKSLGLEELFDDIILVEWAEKALELLPNTTTHINIEKIDDEKRKVIIKVLS